VTGREFGGALDRHLEPRDPEIEPTDEELEDEMEAQVTRHEDREADRAWWGD